MDSSEVSFVARVRADVDRTIEESAARFRCSVRAMLTSQVHWRALAICRADDSDPVLQKSRYQKLLLSRCQTELPSQLIPEFTQIVDTELVQIRDGLKKLMDAEGVAGPVIQQRLDEMRQSLDVEMAQAAAEELNRALRDALGVAVVGAAVGLASSTLYGGAAGGPIALGATNPIMLGAVVAGAGAIVARSAGNTIAWTRQGAQDEFVHELTREMCSEPNINNFTVRFRYRLGRLKYEILRPLLGVDLAKPVEPERELDAVAALRASTDTFCAYESVIWHDPNVHGMVTHPSNPEAHENVSEHQPRLLKRYPDLKCFDSWQAARDFLTDQETSEPLRSYKLCTSGTHGEQLTRSVHGLRNVLSITVFCANVEYHTTWAQNFAKVLPPTANVKQMVADLAQPPEEERAAFLPADTVQSRIDRATLLFLESPLMALADALTMEDCIDMLLRRRDADLWTYRFPFSWTAGKPPEPKERARLIETLNLEKACRTDGAMEIMKLWTMERIVPEREGGRGRPIYRELTRMLRLKLNNADGLKAAKIAQCFALAMQTLQAAAEQAAAAPAPAPAAAPPPVGTPCRGTYFRGLALSEELVTEFSKSVGQVVFFRELMATTDVVATALSLMQLSLSPQMHKKVMLEVDCSQIPLGATGPINITRINACGESEIVIPPLTLFGIAHVERDVDVGGTPVDLKVGLVVKYVPSNVDAAYIYSFS